MEIHNVGQTQRKYLEATIGTLVEKFLNDV